MQIPRRRTSVQAERIQWWSMYDYVSRHWVENRCTRVFLSVSLLPYLGSSIHTQLFSVMYRAELAVEISNIYLAKSKGLLR